MCDGASNVWREYLAVGEAPALDSRRELTRALRESLMKRSVDPRQRQVPWTAVIDASGTRLAVAEINGTTVGFPSTPEEIDRFLSTLREGAPGIADADLKQLRNALLSKP